MTKRILETTVTIILIGLLFVGVIGGSIMFMGLAFFGGEMTVLERIMASAISLIGIGYGIAFGPIIESWHSYMDEKGD